MGRKNQKGETLVETVVSMAILTVLLASVFTILLFSARVTGHSLDMISNTNSEIFDVYNGAFDFSAEESFAVPIDLTFSVTDREGHAVALSNRYDVAGGVRAFMTDSGLIVLRWTP